MTCPVPMSQLHICGPSAATLFLSPAPCFPLGHRVPLFPLPSLQSHPGERPEVLDLKTKIALPGPQITSVCPV